MGKSRLAILAVSEGMGCLGVQVGGPAGVIRRFHFSCQLGVKRSSLGRLASSYQLVGLVQFPQLDRTEWIGLQSGVAKTSEHCFLLYRFPRSLLYQAWFTVV
jgi:hypothetical protein